MFKAGYVELMRLSRERGGGTGQGQQRTDAGNDTRHGRYREHRALPAAVLHRGDDPPGEPDPFPGHGRDRRALRRPLRHCLGHHGRLSHLSAKGSANLATVAPGIAEALITTAIGLVAAIPAVMAFNFFARKIKVISNEMDSFGTTT